MLRKVSYGIAITVMIAAAFQPDAPGPLENGAPQWTIIFSVILMLLALSFLIHSAALRLSRAVREAELEDAGAEDALGNLDEAVRKRAVKHFKGAARQHKRFFVQALLWDTLPLLLLSALAAYCAIALLQKALAN